ncbi:tetratricopeptide repeat protein [Roseibium sp. RKSG952]|nr:tetratricopeptide repeat protein [Roseibium sp. RKSG952]
MRFSVFILFVFVSALAAQAQPTPDLGPESELPSVDDLDTLPELEIEEGAGTVADGSRDLEVLDALFEQLAISGDPQTTEAIANEIQKIWLKSGSDTVDVLMQRASKAMQADDHGLALDLLDVIVTLKPDFAEGWNRRATVFYMRQDYGSSLADIERTLALEPRHWGALSGLAIIQRRLGVEDRALDSFRQALKIHPGLENARTAVEELELEEQGEPI